MASAALLVGLLLLKQRIIILKALLKFEWKSKVGCYSFDVKNPYENVSAYRNNAIISVLTHVNNKFVFKLPINIRHCL